MKVVNEGMAMAPDRAGMFTSLLCAAHCLANTFLPGALAAAGLAEIFGYDLEWLLTLMAIVLASLAMVGGFRNHGSVYVAAVMGVGILGLISARVVESMEIGNLGVTLAVLSGLTLVAGHILNRYTAQRA